MNRSFILSASIVLLLLFVVAVASPIAGLEYKYTLPDALVDVIIEMAGIRSSIQKQQQQHKKRSASFTFYDLGTNDGRVAIAAAKAGATKVFAVGSNLTKAKATLKALSLQDDDDREYKMLKQRIEFVKLKPAQYADGSANELAFDEADAVLVNHFPSASMSMVGSVLFAQMEPKTKVLSVQEGFGSFPPTRTFSMHHPELEALHAQKRRNKNKKKRNTRESFDVGAFEHVVSAEHKSDIEHNVGFSARFTVDLENTELNTGELTYHKLLSSEIEPGRAFMGTISNSKLAEAHKRARARRERESLKTKRLVYDKDGSIQEKSLDEVTSGTSGSSSKKNSNKEDDDTDAKLDHLLVSPVLNMATGNVSGVRFQFSDGARRVGDTMYEPIFWMRVVQISSGSGKNKNSNNNNKNSPRAVSVWTKNVGEQGQRFSFFGLGANGEYGVPVPATFDVEVSLVDPNSAPDTKKLEEENDAHHGDL